MVDVYGGRVLAGEDSEEDDEDEEELNFQLNGLGSPAVARFAVPTIAALPSGAKGREDEESDEEEDSEEYMVKLEKETNHECKEIKEDDKELDGAEENKIPIVNQNDENKSKTLIDEEDLWQLDESVNGIEVMGHAFIDAVRPSLDVTIHRIGELKENQQRLLKVLTEQNAGIKSNKQLEDAAVILDKLPFYTKKLEGIKKAMQEISISTDKMKRRTESLIVDAQSRK